MTTIREICDERHGQSEVARFLKVSSRTVRRWVAEDWMPLPMLERLGYTYQIKKLFPVEPFKLPPLQPSSFRTTNGCQREEQPINWRRDDV